jgi:hypothetical protein
MIWWSQYIDRNGSDLHNRWVQHDNCIRVATKKKAHDMEQNRCKTHIVHFTLLNRYCLIGILQYCGYSMLKETGCPQLQSWCNCAWGSAWNVKSMGKLHATGSFWGTPNVWPSKICARTATEWLSAKPGSADKRCWWHCWSHKSSKKPRPGLRGVSDELIQQRTAYKPWTKVYWVYWNLSKNW